ncbi:MAG: hypothetical protein U0W24_15335 [Bacteroidales bacterium]
MNWYSAIAKRIGKGIVLFLFPIMILIFIFEKAINIAQDMIQPIKSHLPAQRILGIGLFSLLSLFLILLICFIAGWLSDRKRVKSFLSFFEDNLLIFIPGYAMLKSSADAGIEDKDNDWKVVLIHEDDDLLMGIEVDRRPDGYSMVFFPSPPDAKSGDMKLMPESKLKRIDFPVNKLEKMIRNYGKDSAYIPK